MQKFDASKARIDNKYFICDIAGTLYYKDTQLIEFEIHNMKLIYAKDLSGGKLYPFEFAYMGLSYLSFNTFFNQRVVRENAMYMRDYLDCMGLDHYDFEELIKKMNGWNAVGNFWVRFKDMGAQCWNDIITQKYPIY